MRGKILGYNTWYNEIVIHAFVSSMFMIYGCDVCICELICCIVCWIRENKSPTAAEDTECKSSCCEVEVLMNFRLEK